MPIDLEEILEDLERIREEKNMAKDRFAIQELDVTPATYVRWTQGHNTPNTSNLTRMVEYIEEFEGKVKNK